MTRGDGLHRPLPPTCTLIISSNVIVHFQYDPTSDIRKMALQLGRARDMFPSNRPEYRMYDTAAQVLLNAWVRNKI